MNTRIKAVRKSLGLSQTAFGEKLGVTRNIINDAENGRVVPKELLLQHLCSVFGVNDEWLRTGAGEMFRMDNSSVVEQIAAEYQLDEVDRAIIERYLQLEPPMRAVIKQYLESITSAFYPPKAAAPADASLAAIAAMQDYASMVADEKDGEAGSSTSAG